METRKRSILKAITWRVIATVTTFSVAYLLTRELAVAAGIGLVDTSIKVFAYYSHERLWARVDFGRKEKIRKDYVI